MKLRDRKKIQRLLIERISNGETKADACAALGVSRRSVTRWVERDPEFAERWRAARIEQAHSLADDAVRIANESVAPGDMVAVQRNRLRVDTLKWLTSKIAPRLYGERIVAEHNVRAGVVVLPAIGGGEPLVVRHEAPTLLAPLAPSEGE